VDDVLLDVDVEDSRRLIIQYAWSREHRDESPCGARAAAMAGAYDVHRTWASTIQSI
jgi:hypothetical protein